MSDSTYFTLLLIRHFSPQSDQQIERFDSIRAESDAIKLAEQRAQSDPPSLWNRCAIVGPDDSIKHGARVHGLVDWSVGRKD